MTIKPVEYREEDEPEGIGAYNYATCDGVEFCAPPHRSYQAVIGQTFIGIGRRVGESATKVAESGRPAYVTIWMVNVYDCPPDHTGNSIWQAGKQFEEDKDGAFRWAVEQLKQREQI